MLKEYDVIVLGAGAAGLMCAVTAGRRNRSVLVLEASNKAGKKILMSGGGRCNFTNTDIQPEHYICSNPHFVKSALARYTQWDFINMVEQSGIAYYEKKDGQLFCENSAKDILNMLLTNCEQLGVQCLSNYQLGLVEKSEQGFILDGRLSCRSLVVATGGLSIPTLGGATGFGYQLAEQFDLPLVERQASLVPLTLTGKLNEFVQSLAGVSLKAKVSVDGKSFYDDLLFTHRGISGPAILQISNYWQTGQQITIDLCPEHHLCERLKAAKQYNSKQTVFVFLSDYFPRSLLEAINKHWVNIKKPLQEFTYKALEELANNINAWAFKPAGTEGYRTAEVTKGGVCVSAISSKTMQAKEVEGLYFIGEVLDVTGHLGGYNFQWAWSSAVAAGDVV